jgi:hypothetical protein
MHGATIKIQIRLFSELFDFDTDKRGYLMPQF